MKKTTDLVAANTNGYIMPHIDPNKEYTDMEGIDPKFPRISLPNAGATQFKFADSDGMEQSSKSEFEAIILVSKPYRAYYKNAYNPAADTTPDCRSFDGKTGEGNPGGSCKRCPLNQFGENKAGKPCKEKRSLMLLCADSTWPYRMTLPTGSINAYNAFAIGLMSKGKSINDVVAKFFITPTTSKSGKQYSKISISIARDLTEKEHEQTVKMREQTLALLNRIEDEE